MQLKRLEMCGFKSFANRTQVDFNQGVTGIVGPNGCGKSNVVDAIKWVLGTLSYKSVRGNEMLDVIFKGAQGVSAMGFAEVSLTLDNSDKTLPVDFEEVTITRRLFSDGRGEYAINKATCRLKDIRELLYGTGIGTDNYSIIEQNKIDRLVTSNPHERRLVFDEAAGISKYRARKRETTNRLEKVSQDLFRLQDRIHDVQKQLRSVRAQAGRAQRRREMEKELKGKRLRLFLHERRALERRGVEIQERLGQLAGDQRRLRAELEAANRASEEARNRLEEERRVQAQSATAVQGLENQVAYLQRSIEASVQRRRELEEELSRGESDRSGHEAREHELSGRLETEGQTHAEFEAAAARKEQEVAEISAHLEEARQECARIAETLDRKKHEAVELAHKEAANRNERDRLQKDREGLEARANDVRARIAKVEEELGELRAGLQASAKRRAEIDAEIDLIKERKNAEDQAQARRREEHARLERDLTQLREAKDQRVARRETLRDLEEQLEGLDTGAKALLRDRPEGVLGTVADFIEVVPERAPMIEGALGDRAGAVVFETQAQAVRAMELVRDRQLGRTTILSLEECRNGRHRFDISGSRGVFGRASDWVLVEDRARAMIDVLLGHTMVVDGPDTARAMRASGLAEGPVVTQDGDRFEAHGLVTTAGARAQGLITRKSDMRRLEEEIDRYVALVDERDARREELVRAIEEGEARAEELRQAVYEKNVARGEVVTQAEQLTIREQFLSGESESLAGEIEAIGRQASAIADRQRALETLLADMEALRARIAEEIAGLTETKARYDRAREDLREQLTRMRVEAAQACEKRDAVEKRVEMLQKQLDEAVAARSGVEARLEETRGRMSAATAEAQRSAEEQEGLSRRLEEAKAHAAGADDRVAGLEEATQAAEAERERIDGAMGPCEDELQQLRIEEGEHRVKADGLDSRAREELDLDLAQAVVSEPVEEGIDGEALSREVDVLRAKLSNFGSVNAVALEQLEELEKSEKELLGQREDLDESKSKLEALIRELNRESRELFEKTFELVREKFCAIFRKAFGGGKADIILEEVEGVDPMEQGLEIMARPPGKELSSISLLSGGEKTLTAFALVMALFNANPSPFCLLDEADAALDEHNVGRYAGLVREFSGDTQFIVITHNKVTMAVADALYGVTMEQRGVSKKVSVSLSGNDNLDLLKGRQPAPAGA